MDPTALLLVVLASVFLGTFGLGMKYISPLAWEAWWLLDSLISMIVFPVAWALFVVPDLWGASISSPSHAISRFATTGIDSQTRPAKASART